LEKKVGAIMDLMEAADDPFPASFSAEQQALFGLGYYHENSARFSKHSSPANSSDSIEEGADQ
ncbi:MAG: type I-C CRISPR-associated protein Cas8c/Csd1, partial [Gammaproteobacteria bacterium]|nr:type I-C CRISPR-associated protein Cas8c/Csd1 [Gammaproteobacteria bacterium]